MPSQDEVRKKPRAAQRRMAIIILLLLGAAGASWWYLQNLQSREPLEHWSVRAQNALEQSNIEQARKILLDAHRDEPRNAELVQMLGQVEFVAGDYEAAYDYFQNSAELAPETAAFAKMRAAQCAMRLHHIDETLALLQEVLQISPRLVEARRMLINLYENLMMPHSMRKQIIQLDLQQEINALDLALFCSGDRLRYEVNENIDRLEKFLNQDPSHPIIAAALAQNLVRATRRDEAVRLLKRVRSRSQHPDRWRLDLGLIEDEIFRANFASAARQLENLPPEADLLPRTWIARGRAWRELEKLDEALLAFENAAILDPFDPEPHYARSQILLSLGETEQAQREGERSRKLQHLMMLIEDALQLEEAAVPARVLVIARLLQELDFPRPCQICLQWLIAQDWKVDETQELLSELEQRYPVVPGLIAFDRDSLHSLDSPRLENPPNEPQAGPDRDSHVDSLFSLTDVADKHGLRFTYQNGDPGTRLLITSLGGGVAAFDYDNDGWCDLLFAQGVQLPIDSETSTAMPEVLYRNQQGQRFERIETHSLPVSKTYSHGIAVADWNSDGFDDFLICNYGKNELFRNNGDGTFSRMDDKRCRFLDEWSTSAAFADLDRDGDLDLYVVNYVIAPYSELKPCFVGDDYAPCRPLAYQAQQDRLFENLGNGRFAETTTSAGITASDGKGLGVIMADFDLDGKIDIFVGNDTTPNHIYRNRTEDGGPISFESAGILAGAAVNRQGRAEACMGIACADIDRDSYPDLFVSNFEDETNTFYHNLKDFRFEDQTEQFGLADASYHMLGWGAQFCDLDFDGWEDLLITNGHLHDRPMPTQVFRNERGKSFSPALRNSPHLDKERLGRAVALIDWNRDLRNDVVLTDLTDPATLLENRFGGPVNVLAVRLIGTHSNRDGLGARVEARVGGETIVKQLHASGGYLSQNEHLLWFSHEDGDAVDRLTVHWSDGEVDSFESLPFGQFYTIIQGGSLTATAAAVLQ